MPLLTARCSVCDRPKFVQFMFELPQFRKDGKPILLCERCHTSFVQRDFKTNEKVRRLHSDY